MCVLYSNFYGNENAKFGSILYPIGKGNIPEIFLIHLGHLCYILSTFNIHSTYSNCILFQFLDAQTVFGSHAGSILTAFVQHSRHLLTIEFWQQLNCIYIAFEVHSEHYDSILNIPTMFQLHLSCIREPIHAECARIIRCGFAVNS